jgi:Gpi18-like mannosyltransferase
MATVYRAWDGPNYLTVARTLYDVRDDNPLLAYVYTKTYFFVHLPVYPLLVRAFSFVGWQRALLVVSVLCTTAGTLLFYRLLRDVWKVQHAFWLSLVFLFLPPRWLLYRSVGSTEGTYLLLLVGSVFLFERGRTGWASAVGGLAALTRISGLMLAPAYAVVLLRRKRLREVPFLVLVGLPLGLYFVFCFTRTGDFFQYFRPHAEKVARFVPFGFLPHLFAQGLYHHVEFYILLALVYAVGISRIREHETAFWYCVFEFALLVCVSTEEWSRYWLAMAPFALVLGYRDILSTRAFRWIFPFAAVMSFVYSWGALPINTCRRDIYSHLVWHLGLFKELVR